MARELISTSTLWRLLGVSVAGAVALVLVACEAGTPAAPGTVPTVIPATVTVSEPAPQPTTETPAGGAPLFAPLSTPEPVADASPTPPPEPVADVSPTPPPDTQPTPIPADTPVPPQPSQTETPAASDLSAAALKYRLIDSFGDVFFCDRDSFPVARQGAELESALEQFPSIQADSGEFQAIISRIGLAEAATYTDDQQLDVYREHKKLSAVLMSPSNGAFAFELRVGAGSGVAYKGVVDPSGKVEDLSEEPSVNMCPICLPGSALIDTPNGQIPIDALLRGMEVWTEDIDGNRVPGVVDEVASSPVPSGHQMVRATLSDGRQLIASPGHPLEDARTLADLEVGSSVDGATVISVALIEYAGSETYDLLASGDTGHYWSDGVLVGSTMFEGPTCHK